MDIMNSAEGGDKLSSQKSLKTVTEDEQDQTPFDSSNLGLEKLGSKEL